MRSRTVTLQKERTKDDSRSLRARLSTSGDLSIEGHDIGSGVELFWGRGHTEYEWVITLRAAHVPTLVAALGGESGNDVLKLLSQRYSENPDCASQTFLKEHGIPIEFWSRVGD